MRILICSDIHGNYYALKTLLDSKIAKTCDKIMVLGDLVCMGPQPNECIDLVKNNPKCEVVMGNHDKWIAVEPPPSSVTSKKIKHKHHIFMEAITTDENLNYLASLPYFIEKTIYGKKIYFTHYGWKDNFTEVISHPDILENENNIEEIFPNIKSDLVFFGHNHNSLYLKHKGIEYYCVGTLGMAKQGNYIILTINENCEYKIERKLLNYHRFKTIKIMKQLKYPRYHLYCGYIMGFVDSIYKQNIKKISLDSEE